MASRLSRREFLQLGGLAAGGLALRPALSVPGNTPSEALGLVRVGTDEIRLYSEPSYSSDVVATRKKDQLLYYYDLLEADGPDFNPRWYQVDEGYAHTAYLQPVQTVLNEVRSNLREGRYLAEVTVPITQSFRDTATYGWTKLYRLYYRSTHWVTGIKEGPDGALWYEIEDELLYIKYYVLASHLRLIPDEEISPIAGSVEPAQKRVEVSIAEQRLWAYEGDEVVLDTKISTGIPYLVTSNGIPAATPVGAWTVFSKMPVRHMGNGAVTADPLAYELPGVPWVSYFHEWGVAFHGTYWHDNYGNEMSHGCVNMTPDEAKWMYRWLGPEHEQVEVQTVGHGTRVWVRAS